jgi:predicted kinase
MVLTIIRGVSGAGKTTVAKALAEVLMVEYFEADMYFMRDGTYQFDASLLGRAHAWCKRMVGCELEVGRSVIVSNTFTRVWELKPYLDMADMFGADVQVIEVQGDFPNHHDVPKVVVTKMRNRWEDFRL